MSKFEGLMSCNRESAEVFRVQNTTGHMSTYEQAHILGAIESSTHPVDDSLAVDVVKRIEQHESVAFEVRPGERSRGLLDHLRQVRWQIFLHQHQVRLVRKHVQQSRDLLSRRN